MHLHGLRFAASESEAKGKKVYFAGKRCYGFKTDTRSIESSLDINPMITGCLIKFFKNYDGDKLTEEIRSYLSENEL